MIARPSVHLTAALAVFLLSQAAVAAPPASDGRATVVRLPSAGRVIPLPARVRLLARTPRPLEPDPLPALPVPQPRPETAAVAIDDRPFWAAVARGDLVRARQLHAELQASGTSWPDADRAIALVTLLQAEADLKQAASARDWPRVIAVADRQPGAVSCARAYNFWPVADAYHGLGRTAELTALYEGVVGACANEADRLTALERAFAQLPSATMADLLLLERPHDRSAAADQRFEGLEYRLNAARLTANLAAPDEAAIASAVLARRDAATAVSLGWSSFRTGRLAQAEEWFRTVVQWTADPAAAEGLANTLLRRKRPADAAAVVDEYLDQDPRARPLRQRIHTDLAAAALAAGEFDQALTEVASARSLGAADSGLVIVEGWALLQSGRAEPALSAFAAAAELGAGDGATLGLVRTYLALDRLGAAERSAADLPAPMAEPLVAEINIRLADQAYTQRRYDDSIAYAQRAQASPDYAVDALALEAWSRFRRGDFKASETLFEWLYRTDPRQDYADGLYLSLTGANKQPKLRDLADELGGALAERVRRAEIFGG